MGFTLLLKVLKFIKKTVNCSIRTNETARETSEKKLKIIVP